MHKPCWNLYDSIFIIFIVQCQVNWVGKSICFWHPKSWDFLLTHWLPIKSILFLIETIERYQFRCNYLGNKTLFLNFLLHFWNLNQILNSLKKKIILIDFVISKLRTPKTYSDKCLKSPVLEDPPTSNMLNVPWHCRNLHYSTFIIFIDHYQVNLVWKWFSYWHGKS